MQPDVQAGSEPGDEDEKREIDQSVEHDDRHARDRADHEPESHEDGALVPIVSLDPQATVIVPVD